VSRLLSRAWVVIPAFRESQTIRQVVEGLKRWCAGIVVVDDGSHDATAAEALAGGAIVLKHAVNLGQGAALQTGIDFILRDRDTESAEYIFTFDADGQHQTESLATLAETLERSGADVVLGSRWLGTGQAERIPAFRKAVLRAAVVFTRLHSGLGVSDTHNGLRLFTRSAAAHICITQPRMAHASEILQQIRAQRLRFEEAPVTIRYTEYSLAKGQRVTGLFRILLDIFYARWTR
jgi:glycosyltransferase involved in cell wall biosynthesis